MSRPEPGTTVTLSAPTTPPPAAERLDRRFRAMVFDWDGTAVVDRRENAEALVTVAEALLEHGVWLVVVTGTNYGHVDEQFCRFVAPHRRQRLVVCTNRGSEVYGFDHRGTPVRRFLRVATPAEDRALSVIAEGVRDEIQRQTGLEIHIVYDRLNRRKIDLIPLPAWTDPPKARIGERLAAVEDRLQSAGWTGGLGAAISLTARLAREHGLPGARITSDVKHIEVGLTDKGDAFTWVQRELLPRLGIALDDVLVAGDEFGPIGAAPGSDDRLRAEAGAATVVSVGAEPNGVPTGVFHLGGGPPRFRALLADQVLRHRSASAMAGSHAPTVQDTLPRADDPAWRLDGAGLRRARERSLETLFTIANGFLGVRGALDEPTHISRRHTLVAGLFDVPRGSAPVPTLIPGPDCLRFRLDVDGRPLAIDFSRGAEHQRPLDLRHGALLSRWRRRDASGRNIEVRTLRVASLADRHLLIQVVQIAVDRPTSLTLHTAVEISGDGLVAESADPTLSVWRTREGAKRLAVATHATVEVDQARLPPETRDDHLGWRWVALPGETSGATRVASVARSDPGRPEDDAPAELARARKLGIPRLLRRHMQAWEKRWEAADIGVDGDDQAQRALRFALYHLISAANPEDEHTSIGARALTGDAYLGHVFWDTDIFVLPFYTFTWPAAARAALMYRSHTLPAARAKAAALGYQGALYAWESADTGAETTPPYVLAPTGEVIPIRCGQLEQHISADVAYAVWQYWQVTADTQFLLNAGAEILLETARFWASRAVLETDGRFHIRGVIGPDEYHDAVDDNAYTNGMAQWNLERGVAVAGLLRVRWPAQWSILRDRLGVDDAELAEWGRVAAGIAFTTDPSSGVLEQFAGFSNLEEVDLTAFAVRTRTAPIDIVLGAERVRQAQILKQADVVMLLALLPERFAPDARAANFRYYEPRCAQGSSLSPAVHALVAARLGDQRLAEHYFREAATIDLDDALGNAARGIHIGALGGLWQATVFGFGGLSPRPDGIALDPRLPASWGALRFPLRWRGRAIRVAIEQAPLRLAVTLEHGRPLTLHLGDVRRRLQRGDPSRWQFDERDSRWREARA